MIGISLPYTYLENGGEPYGSRTRFLKKLRAAGVGSVELRTVRYNAAPQKVRAVAESIWEAGLQITVHAGVRTAATAVEDVFAPLAALIPALGQTELIVVIHPVAGTREEMLDALGALADHIRDHAPTVKIALENNRRMPDRSMGDSVALVTELVTALNRTEVGICFDMGHYFWAVGKDKGKRPPQAFLNKIIHTHIHALCGETTHFPLGRYELPVSEYIAAFSQGYAGRYNLELEYERYAGQVAADDAVFESIEALKAALPLYAPLYDDVRAHFTERLLRAGSVFESPKNVTAAALIHSSSYLFSTNGYHWAMDVALRDGGRLSDAPRRLAAVMKDAALMVVTHGHEDHFERETVALLRDLPMTWLVPDFLYDMAVDYGVPPEKLRLIRAGETTRIGPLTITAFQGRHYRPGTSNGVETLGYIVTAENAPKLVFPADVRDFRTDGLPECAEADALFAHVWLGDDDTRHLDRGAYPDAFARFMTHFHPKRIFYTHLYETARSDEQTWRYVHAGMAADAVKRINPAIEAVIPCMGDVTVL